MKYMHGVVFFIHIAQQNDSVIKCLKWYVLYTLLCILTKSPFIGLIHRKQVAIFSKLSKTKEHTDDDGIINTVKWADNLLEWYVINPVKSTGTKYCT